MTRTDEADLRFSVPLYTLSEAAQIVDVPPSTLASWAKGYVRRFPSRPDVIGKPVITCLSPRTKREPSLPFVGLAEALVLAAVRRSGVPMQRVRPALEALQSRIGVAHALASRRLYTDGAELLYKWNSMSPPFTETTAVRVYHNGTDSKQDDVYDWFWNEDNAALVSQTRRAARSRRAGEAELIRSTFYQAMLLTGVSALRTHERMGHQRKDASHSTETDLGPLPSAEDFVAHATAALAPVAWHIIKDLSRIR